MFFVNPQFIKLEQYIKIDNLHKLKQQSGHINDILGWGMASVVCH